MGISLEGHKRKEERNRQNDESFPEMKDIVNPLQVLLALRAFCATHPELEINLKTPALNDRSIRSRAMQEWVGDSANGTSLATQFRFYIEDPQHEHKHIDLAKSGELDALLASIRTFPHVSDTNKLAH